MMVLGLRLSVLGFLGLFLNVTTATTLAFLPLHFPIVKRRTSLYTMADRTMEHVLFIECGKSIRSFY
jgi:hypothetical protein